MDKSCPGGKWYGGKKVQRLQYKIKSFLQIKSYASQGWTMEAHMMVSRNYIWNIPAIKKPVRQSAAMDFLRSFPRNQQLQTGAGDLLRSLDKKPHPNHLMQRCSLDKTLME